MVQVTEGTALQVVNTISPFIGILLSLPLPSLSVVVSALVRPVRLDMQVTVPRPDGKGRHEIPHCYLTTLHVDPGR